MSQGQESKACQHFGALPFWHGLLPGGAEEREGGHPVDPTTTSIPHVGEGIGHVFPGLPAPCACVTLHDLGQHGLLQWLAPPTHGGLPYVLLLPSASILEEWDWKERETASHRSPAPCCTLDIEWGQLQEPGTLGCGRRADPKALPPLHP